jgi:phage FluMu protein Com
MFWPTMPWQPLILGLKFQVRIANLQATDFLERRCPQCATTTRISSWHLHALFPAHARLVDIESRMRCRRCGRVGPQPWRLWRAHPPIRAVERE